MVRDALLRSAPHHEAALARRNRNIVRARVGQRISEMPPLAEIVLEAVPAHGGKQRDARALLLGGNRGAQGVAAHVETVEAGAHVEAVVGRALRRRAGAGAVARRRFVWRYRLRRPLDEREIDRRAGRMRRLRRDVAGGAQRAMAATARRGR